MPQSEKTKKAKLQSKIFAPGQNFSRKKQNLRAKLLPLGQNNCSEKQKQLLFNIFLIFCSGGPPAGAEFAVSLALSCFLPLACFSLFFSDLVGFWALGPTHPGPYPHWGPVAEGHGSPSRTGPECRSVPIQKLIVPIPRS